MIRSIVVITILFLARGLLAQQWVQVWGDEFNTPGLPDTASWSYEKGLIRNNESQYYTESRSENARIEDTCLIIEARKESYSGAAYTSASLMSRFKGDWLYGRIEVRAKIPTGKGSWPAIWMLPSNNLYGGWPYSGEIDIMENVGYDPLAIVTTVHFYGTDGSGHQSNGTSTFRNTPWEVFYTYAIEWTPEQIDWYIDDIKVHTYYKPSQADWRLWPFDERFYLILNLAIGGTWGGIEGIDPAIFPLKYYIDYVRVYKWQTTSGPYNVTVEPVTGGNVTVTPDQATYEAGTNVELTATADPGYYFGGFLYQGYANPLSVNMVEDITVRPLFYKTGEMIVNGNFDYGITGWNNFYIYDQANQSARAGWDNGVYSFEILKKTSGTEWWHMGDQWLGISAEQGKTYRVKFDAWADAFSQMGLSFSRNHPDYSAYYEDPAINITQTRTTYTRIFTFDDPSDSNCRLYFGLGRFTGKIYLDNVSMAEYDPTPVEGISESGTLPELTVGTDHASHLLQVSIRTGSREHVTLSVCNLFGSTMATLHAGELDPGTHQFQYQADGSLPGGLYLLRTQTPKGESFTKFILY